MTRPPLLLGVGVCVVGNVTICLGQNVFKLAHLRLQQQADEARATPDDVEARSPANEDVSPTRDAGERQQLLRKPSQKSDDSQSDDNQKRVDKSYLRSPLWWAGVCLLTCGELGNFLAYAYAPSSVVAPLGTVALVANCAIAPLLLHESFRRKDLLGIALCILGAVTTVASATQKEEQLTPSEFVNAVAQVHFIVYACVMIVAILALAGVSQTRFGDRFLLVDTGLAALLGGFTVLSTKAFSSFLSLMFLDSFAYPVTWVVLVVLAATAILQLNYINKALQRFEARVVVPTQFCAFSISAIVGSAVLFREFDDVEGSRALNFVFGCALSFFGVYLLTRQSPEAQDEQDASEAPSSRRASNASTSASESPSAPHTNLPGGSPYGVRRQKSLPTIRESASASTISEAVLPTESYDAAVDMPATPSPARSAQLLAPPMNAPGVASLDDIPASIRLATSPSRAAALRQQRARALSSVSLSGGPLLLYGSGTSPSSGRSVWSPQPQHRNYYASNYRPPPP